METCRNTRNRQMTMIYKIQRNGRKLSAVNYNGSDLILVDAAKEMGCGVDVLLKRIKGGWPLDEALNTPVMNKHEAAKAGQLRREKCGVKTEAGYLRARALSSALCMVRGGPVSNEWIEVNKKLVARSQGYRHGAFV